MKTEDENGALERHQSRFLPFPAAFSLDRLRPILPFLAAHAVVERKELLVVVALLLSVPSQASVAVLVGRG